jgi:hypothetical protein
MIDGLPVRPSRIEDVETIAKDIRPMDKFENEVMHDMEDSDMRLPLFGGYVSSKPCYTYVDEDDNAIAMFGATTSDAENKIGVVWLLGTTKTSDPKYVRTFIKGCKPFIDEVCAPYDYVYNFIHKDNEMHQRWLKWLGFTISAHDNTDEPFCQFLKLEKYIK